MSETTVLDAVVSQFRQYDQGVANFVIGGLPTQQDGKNVPVIMATPDRAFSSMRELLNLEETKNVPLPFISIHRSRVVFDPMRFRGNNAQFRKLAVSKDRETTYNAPFPLPYDITFQIEFWAKNRETLNAMELWMVLQFTGGFETFIPIDFSKIPPWEGTKNIPFENEGIQDLSKLDPGDDQRTLRFTQQLTAKAWIAGAVETVKAVLKLTTDFYLVETTTDITSVTGTEVDADPDTFDHVLRVSTDGTDTTITNP